MFVAALSILTAAPALALDWSPGFEQAFPADGTTAVAVNAWPVVEVHAMELQTPDTPDAEHQVSLVLADTGDSIPAAVEHLGSGVYQLQPDEEFLSDTAYALVASPELPVSSNPLATFVTGSEWDSTPPTIPQPLEVYQESVTDEWGDWHALHIVQRPAGDTSAVLHRVTVSTLDCALGVVACEAPEVGIFIRSGVSPEPDHETGGPTETLSFRRDPVGHDDEQATMDPTTSVITIQTEDLAGNRAPLVCLVPDSIDPADVGCGEAALVHTVYENQNHDGRLEDDPESTDDKSPSGCMTGGGASSISLALLALASVLRRRADASSQR